MFLRSQLIDSSACGEVDHQEKAMWQRESCTLIIAENAKERSGEREERTKENVGIFSLQGHTHDLAFLPLCIFLPPLNSVIKLCIY